jgi:aminoglycoside phosphotransferase (APT) family kinase protein
MIEEAASGLGAGWRVSRKLAGGWNQGAYLVCGPGGEQTVLKCYPGDPERIASAVPLIQAARRHGWPTPAWLATGTTRSGVAWVLQEFATGERPGRLDDRVAARMVEVLEVQAGLGKLAGPGWSEWAWGTVFEDWGDYRAALRSKFPRGSEIVAAVDAIASSCDAAPLSAADLVHGNFEAGNTLLDGNRLWVIDAQGVSGGSRAYDLIEALMVGAALEPVTRAGLARLWSYAETLPPGDLAVCAGSVGLTFAEAFLRHGRLAEAPSAVPALLGVLNQARSMIP